MKNSQVAGVAVDVLTPLQLLTWRLEALGMSVGAIAVSRAVSRTTVRETLRTAHRRLLEAGVGLDSSGEWYLKRKAT